MIFFCYQLCERASSSLSSLKKRHQLGELLVCCYFIW